MKLRSKLLLAALVLLLMPMATVKFLKSLDNWLVERESIHLADRAQNLAAGIFPFMQNWKSVPALSGAFPVFPKSLTSLPKLDGFETEWGVTSAHWIQVKHAPMKILLGRADNYQLLFIKVSNLPSGQRPVFTLQYQSAFKAEDEQPVANKKHKFTIIPEAPGKILAKNSNRGIQSRIHGYWENATNSSSLELRVPEDLALSQLKIHIKIGDRTYKSAWLQILKTDSAQQKLLDTIKLSSAERLWLLGPNGEVMGVKGNLQDDKKVFSSNAFLTWLIGTVPDTVDDPWSGMSQIPQSWLQQAQINGVNSRIEAGVNANQKRIVAVARIGDDENLQGYVLFDKLSGTSLLLSQPQVGILINITLALMMLTIFILLVFGGRLSWRIRNLQKQLSDSMDEQGRVTEVREPATSKDEIGQLSVAMNQLLHRQKDYQDYQQKMASRLSHELRTPIAVVRGALDNLRADVTEKEPLQFVERATTGIERMGSLVTRMREAARLEQVISASSVSFLDLNELLETISAGLAATWPEANIRYITNQSIEIEVAPELIAQALEKLLSNAVDFSAEGSEIIISVELENANKDKQLHILVSNIGKLLPQGKEAELIDNMVSVRNKKGGDSSHLGLGLYIVQLIASFHGGEALIRNREDGLGVDAGFSIKCSTRT